MKKYIRLLSLLLIFLISFSLVPISKEVTFAKSEKTPMLAIIIDDFGGYDQSGVETMLSIDAPLTCAVIPHVDNTENNTKRALESGKEVIVHMPMQANVTLPLEWYGKEYISNIDNKQQVYDKLDRAFESVKGASGFNIHIGSGVCQYPAVVNNIYQYSIDNNLYFLDSRTHINTVCDKVAKEKNVVYLGRDDFLEPMGARSYELAKHYLMMSARLAKERGFAIVIGHVGSHGGETTAKAIKDSISEIKALGVDIVPLSKLYNRLNYLHNNK